jgi:hypothetical protein
MKGYGLTVFEGTKPERFGVEVIDVIKNFRPRQDAILIKTLHPRLDVVNVVRGMSGSPIFIDGKMIGAYAYGWSFGKEPVAGVTPIQSMLEDLARPLPKSLFGWPFRPPRAAARLAHPWPSAPSRPISAPSLRRRSERLSAGSSRRAIAPAWTLRRGKLRAGCAPWRRRSCWAAWVSWRAAWRASCWSRSGSSRCKEAGRAAWSRERRCTTRTAVAIAVNLINGDFNATGLGTVTRVEGDRLVAFGHPMMQVRVSALPTAVAACSGCSRARHLPSSSACPCDRSVRWSTIARPRSSWQSRPKPPSSPSTFHIDGVPGAPYRDWTFEVRMKNS